MKQLEIFLLHPGWDASPSQGYPIMHFHYLFVPLGGERQCESQVWTQHNVPPGLKPGIFDLELSGLPTRPLHIKYTNFFKYKSRHFLPACLPFLHLFHLLQLHMYISFQSDLRFSQNRFPFLQETNKNKENHDNDSVWIDREFLRLYFSCFSFVIVLIEEITQKLEIMFDQSASHLEGGQKYSGTHLFSTLFSVFQNVVNCCHLCLMHYAKLALQKFTKIVSCAL